MSALASLYGPGDYVHFFIQSRVGLWRETVLVNGCSQVVKCFMAPSRGHKLKEVTPTDCIVTELHPE